MSLGRRRFLSSVSAGSAAFVAAGCATPGPRIDCPTFVDPPIPAIDLPPAAYFDQLSMDLDGAILGTPVVLVDLDRMEANVDAIARGVAPKRLRIVEKSLPSIELLRHVASRAGTTSFLVLHLPLLGDVVEAFPDADVIVGKTHLTNAVRSFWQELPAGADLAALARRVVFLADGLDRLMELRALARDLGITLRIAIEIDVGLRRSGVSTPEELPAVLAGFAGAAEVELSGLMGYDGHVAFTPRATAAAVLEEWAVSRDVFQRFASALRDAGLDREGLIFHSGGTSTYPLYAGDDTPVNDVATGGGVLRPGEYPDYFLGELSPAIFVAAPVLRQYDVPAVPFLDDATNEAVFGGRQAFTVYGGGWASHYTYPRVGPPPLSGGVAGCSWVPNQGLMTAAPDLPLEVGDWIYFHPLSSDVMFQFERIHLVRDGRLASETWSSYPRRY